MNDWNQQRSHLSSISVYVPVCIVVVPGIKYTYQYFFFEFTPSNFIMVPALWYPPGYCTRHVLPSFDVCRALRRVYATHRPPGRPPPCTSQRRKLHRGRTPGCKAARARCAAAASRMALAVRCCSRPPGLSSRPTHGPRRQGIRYGVRTGRGAVGMPWATSLWPKQRRMLLSLEMRVQHTLWTHPER